MGSEFLGCFAADYADFYDFYDLYRFCLLGVIVKYKKSA